MNKRPNTAAMAAIMSASTDALAAKRGAQARELDSVDAWLKECPPLPVHVANFDRPKRRRVR